MLFISLAQDSQRSTHASRPQVLTATSSPTKKWQRFSKIHQGTITATKTRNYFLSNNKTNINRVKRMRFVRTSYPAESVTFLLQDVKGKSPHLRYCRTKNLNHKVISIILEMLPHLQKSLHGPYFFNSLDQLFWNKASATSRSAEKLWSSKVTWTCSSLHLPEQNTYRHSVQRYLKARYG